MNRLHVFGWTGVQTAYLNLSHDEAKRRYACEHGSLEGVPYESFAFADTFDTYSCSEPITITERDTVAALIATEVRSDVTALASVLGLHAAFTDLGRTFGALFRPEPDRPRGKTPPVPWRLYTVTAGLAQELAARGAAVAEYEGLSLWLRHGSGPIEDDADLRAIAAYSDSGQRPTPDTSR